MIRALIESRRLPRDAAACFAVALGLLLTACKTSAPAITQGCSLNSDCLSGLVCAFGVCRAQCVTSVDCPGAGASCVDDGRSAVCQSPAEKNTPCERPSDCPVPLACASDYRCRNLCFTSADCNVLGIEGRICATDANGVDYCADPSEVSDGKLDTTPPPGASTAPVVEPEGGNEALPSGPASITSVIDARGGTLGIGAIAIAVPPGALAKATTLTISRGSDSPPGAVGAAYEIEPSGTAFALPVTVSFTYTDADLGSLPASDFAVETTTAGGAWVELAPSTVDIYAHTVSGPTNHLSPYALVNLTVAPVTEAGAGTADGGSSSDSGYTDAGTSGARDGSGPVTSSDATTQGAEAGALVAWQTTSALPVPRLHAVGAAPGNGYLYVLDGYTDSSACSVGTADGRAFYATLGANGSLGAWTEATAGTGGFRRSIPGVATANGYIYVTGGAIDGPSWDGNVWFTQPSADGAISGWTLAGTPVPTWVGSSPIVAARGQTLYAGGGFNAFASPQTSTSFYHATLDPKTGQPGVWTQDTPLPAAASVQGELVFYGSYALLVDGTSPDVYVTTVGADGTLGTWTQSPQSVLPQNADGSAAGFNYPSAAVVGSTLYVVPGVGVDVYASPIGANGSLGAFTAQSTLVPATSLGYQAVIANGYYYAVGDDDCNATASQAESVAFIPLQAGAR